MDQVNRLSDAKWRLWITKPVCYATQKKAADDLQLSIYALAAREVLGLRAGRLIFYNLKTMGRGHNARREVARGGEGKDRGSSRPDSRREFSGRSPVLGCGYCDFKPLCPEHEQLIAIQPAVHASR